MKRWLLFTFVLIASAPLLWADNPSAESEAPDRSVQILRNYRLIHALVHGGLQLAAEEDPLKRAQQCNGVAEQLASEIRQAADGRESARVAELGEHLHDLLVQGLAPNVSRARKRIPVGSAQEKDLFQLRDKTNQFVQPLEKQLRGLAAAQEEEAIERMLKSMEQGRTELDKALQLQQER